jgi:hypothetical protein
MVKILKINETYGGPTIMLVHLKQLGLKFNGKDQIG